MSLTLQTRTVTTSPYTIVTGDTVIFVNVAGPASIILPNGSGGDDDRSYFIKDISGNANVNPITITATDGRTIDGVHFAILNGGYSHIQTISDGTRWLTI